MRYRLESAAARERRKPSISFKSMTQFATVFTSVTIALGSVWLALYFAQVVHVVPAVDFGKLAMAIGIIGVLGTLQIITIGFLFSIPALMFEVQLAVAARSLELSVENVFATLVAGPKGRRPLVFYCALGALGLFYEVAVAVAPHPADTWIFVIVSGGTGLVFGLRDRNRLSYYLYSSVYWGFSFPFGLRLMHYSPTSGDQASVAALIGIPFMAVYLNIVFSFRGFIRIMGPVLILFVLIAQSGNVESILGAPIRELNLGFGYRLLTATTHQAAQTAVDCGLLVRRRHFTAFVLSDLGESYIIRCDRTKRAMEIPKSEANQRTIAFPKAEVTPEPSPSSTATARSRHTPRSTPESPPVHAKRPRR